MAEAVTLAHVARVHALAQLLDPNEFEICIAADPRFDSLFAPTRFDIRSIGTIPSARFAIALESGRPVYDEATLEAYVADDLRVIHAFDPDVVIGDFRLSLSVSARLAGKPYVSIANAGWSPYANVRFPIPSLPMVRLGLPIAQRIFDLARPLAFRMHARSLDAVRRRHAMPALRDLRAVYTDGDRVLYADVPDLFRMSTLPATHAFLGAILWSPDVARPSWWGTLPKDGPVVYVTLGSSGASALLETIIEALGSLDATVIVATAGRLALPSVPANTRVTDFLPGTEAARRASVVICNGGSPTCYQALAAGVPVLGIPSNLDQLLNISAVADFGAGILVRPEKTDEGVVARSVEQLLRSENYRLRAERLRDAIAAGTPAATMIDTIRLAIGVAPT